MEVSKKTLNASQHPGNLPGGDGAHYSVQLLEKARADTDTVLKELGSQPGGLSETQADSRLKQVGTNEIAREKHQSPVMRLLANIKNPLVLLLLALGVLSFLTGDLQARSCPACRGNSTCGRVTGDDSTPRPPACQGYWSEH